jgi:hypothetical protein
MRKLNLKVVETTKPEGKQYIVTDKMSGSINGKRIEAKRGDRLVLTDDEAKTFAAYILEL